MALEITSLAPDENKFSPVRSLVIIIKLAIIRTNRVVRIAAIARGCKPRGRKASGGSSPSPPTASNGVRKK